MSIRYIISPEGNRWKVIATHQNHVCIEKGNRIGWLHGDKLKGWKKI